MKARKLHHIEIASIPDPVLYVNRTIAGKQDFEIFDFAFENALNILMEGPTGPGKTTASVAYSAQRRRRMATIPSNVGVEPTQLFGKYIPDGHGGWVWIDGPITTVVRYGGTLLINEVAFMPERVSTAVFGLFDGRREITLLDHEGEIVRAHRPNCWCDLPANECRDKWLLVFADMNPHYSGTRELNAAFRNRFNIQLVWDYDRDVEEQLIKSIPLLDFMWKLRSDVATEVYSTPVSTNMGMEFERITRGLGYDFAVLNFVNHFATEERESIIKLFEAQRNTIEPSIPKHDLTPEEVFERRLKMKIGDRDDEFGVYGIEWVWEDDDAPEGEEPVVPDDDVVPAIEVQVV